MPPSSEAPTSASNEGWPEPVVSTTSGTVTTSEPKTTRL